MLSGKKLKQITCVFLLPLHGAINKKKKKANMQTPQIRFHFQRSKINSFFEYMLQVMMDVSSRNGRFLYVKKNSFCESRHDLKNNRADQISYRVTNVFVEDDEFLSLTYNKQQNE
jgi:hypothetical protein